MIALHRPLCLSPSLMFVKKSAQDGSSWSLDQMLTEWIVKVDMVHTRRTHFDTFNGKKKRDKKWIILWLGSLNLMDRPVGVCLIKLTNICVVLSKDADLQRHFYTSLTLLKSWRCCRAAAGRFKQSIGFQRVWTSARRPPLFQRRRSDALRSCVMETGLTVSFVSFLPASSCRLYLFRVFFSALSVCESVIYADFGHVCFFNLWHLFARCHRRSQDHHTFMFLQK